MQIKGKPSILQKVVFELKYQYGFTYLDKCGRAINAIMREQPEWTVRDSISPTASSLVSMRNGCSFSFSAFNYNFALERPAGGDPLSDKDMAGFTQQVDLISSIVNDHLGLKEFTRIGFRVWYLFSCEDKEEAESWLSYLGLYMAQESLISAFGGKKEALGVTVVVSGSDRKYRIAFNAVERRAEIDLGEAILTVQASKLSRDQQRVLQEKEKVKSRMRANPKFPAMIDIDAFQDEPLLVEPRDFIKTSHEEITNRLMAAIANP
jgi:hypothetical protein